MADSIVRLKVEDSSFNAKIKEAARSFADFGKRVASAGADAMADFAKGVKTAKVAFQGFNAALKANALVLVASLAVQAASAIGEMIGDWISGADDAADAQERLNQKLETTKMLIEQINDEGDFNARIAKAQGKSTTEILQMKVAQKEAAAKVAANAVMTLGKDATSEQIQKVKDQLNKAQAELQKAKQDLKVDEIARQYKTGEYATKGGGSGRSGKTNLPSIDSFDKALAKSLTGSVDLKEVKDQLSPFQLMLPEIEKNILGIKDADLGGALAELGNKEVIDQIKAITLQVEQQQKAFELAAQSAANLGSALAGMQDPGIKAAGTVLSAIANLALSFSQAALQASQLGSYGWIAYMAAGPAALATTISTIHSLTGYATGGEIKGNSYSGDNIPIMANAGEIVLNKAQQATLASSIQQNGGGGSRVVGILKGEDIVLMADRWGMRTGRGELLFGKNL